jgi:uroporphyrinogen decarboxylase
MWFHPETARRLSVALEVPSSAVGSVLGDDVQQRWVGNNWAMEGIVHDREGETHLDDWGIEWIRIGAFNQIRVSPLEHAEAGAVRQYSFPYGRISALLQSMDTLRDNPEDLFTGCDVSPCLFELLCRLRGMERAMLDLAESPALAEDLLEGAARFTCLLAEEACTRTRPDWLWTGDDVAGQRALLMSPSTWRSMIAPKLERIVAVGKRAGIPVAYHCCGAMRPIIPDLIEMGIDVLNPIQSNCPGMDPIDLKREFGRHLTFMGGVDTTDLLPRQSSDEVFRSTRTLIEGMTADGGGYILAASHTVPPETPLDNIFAMYKAAGVSREEILDRAGDLRRRLSLRAPANPRQ